ncbi:hypothetical protein HR51_20930 [Burkholderia cepacia]|nr:hypothetical protein HR51_20930 [Burkholderia cepacia]
MLSFTVFHADVLRLRFPHGPKVSWARTKRMELQRLRHGPHGDENVAKNILAYAFLAQRGQPEVEGSVARHLPSYSPQF